MSLPYKFERIREVSRDILLNANEYANATRKATREGKSEKIGKWFTDVRVVQYIKPFFRTVEGYDNTYFVIDVDIDIPNEKNIKKYYSEDELREIKIKSACNYFEVWFAENSQLDFLIYISGKGMYFIQKYDKAIAKEIFFPVVWNGDKGLFKPCTKKGHKIPRITCDGWHLYDGNDLVLHTLYDKVEVRLKIDLRMFTGLGGRLFRVPYSPYYKFNTIYHCVPLKYNEDGSWDVNGTIENSLYYNMVVEPYRIPSFQFAEKLEVDTNIESVIKRRKQRQTSFIYKIDVPEPHEELNEIQQQMIDQMEEMVTGDVYQTAPCIKRSYLRDPSNPVDRHFARVNVLRYLAVKGNYTPSDIGLFIRFKVNNEEDNRPENKHVLHQQVPYWYGNPNSPDYPAKCTILQNPRSRFFSCGDEEKSICNRTYCLASQHKKIKQKQFMVSRKKDKKKDIDVDNQAKSFNSMNRKITKVLKNPNVNYELIKTTRAGVTTSIMKEGVRLGKKILVIIPTNAIGEKTGSDALWLIKETYDINVNCAVFSSNKKSCLKLMLKRKDLHTKKTENPDWGEDKIAYDKLAFHFKPSCILTNYSCKYLNDVYNFPNFDRSNIPLPVIESKVEKYEKNNVINSEGICAYQSILHNIEDIDVLFITYDKLRALSLSDDKEILSYLVELFDVVFLDEISQFAQKSSDNVQLFSLDDGGNEWSLIDAIEREIAILSIMKDNETAIKLIDIIEEFKDEYGFKLLEWHSNKKFTKRPFIEKFNNCLSFNNDLFLNDNFSVLYGIIEQFTREYNIHLKYIEKVLLLLTSKQWWVQNIPTNENLIDCKIISSPIIDYAREFVGNFNMMDKKQVLVTDATMPYIKMSQLLDIKFERFVIGDPRNTNDYQLIVTDNKVVFPFRLFMGGKDNYLRNLIETINNVANQHKAENIMIVLPNSRKIYNYVKWLQKEEKISKRIEITYYRSDKTVGVSSDRRIMITVCAPYPPKGSYLWLASYYHEIGLFTNIPLMKLSKNLEDMNAHQTYYQTIGRAKAPDNSERSIVYAWGIDGKILNKIIQMDEDVAIPHIVDLKYKNTRVDLLTHISEMWIRHGIIVNTTVIRIINYLEKYKKQKYSLSMLKTILRLQDKDTDYLSTANPTLFDYFGVFYEKTNDTIYLYIDE